MTLHVAAADNASGYRKLAAGLAKSFAGYGFSDSVNFEQNSSRFYVKAESLGVSLTLTHTYLGSFRCDRSVGEYADPVLAGLAERSGNNLSSCLDLV